MKRVLASLLALALSIAPLHAQDLINPQTDASKLTTGVLSAARGGAGTISGALKANGSGTVSQAASTDLSDTTAATTWTPTDASGASLVFTGVTGNFSKSNKTCVGEFRVTFPTTANGSLAAVTLPCTSANNGNHALGSCVTGAASPTGVLILFGTGNAATAQFFNITGSGNQPTNANLSTFFLSCNFSFITT